MDNFFLVGKINKKIYKCNNGVVKLLKVGANSIFWLILLSYIVAD